MVFNLVKNKLLFNFNQIKLIFKLNILKFLWLCKDKSKLKSNKKKKINNCSIMNNYKVVKYRFKS